MGGITKDFLFREERLVKAHKASDIQGTSALVRRSLTIRVKNTPVISEEIDIVVLAIKAKVIAEISGAAAAASMIRAKRIPVISNHTGPTKVGARAAADIGITITVR